MPESLPLDNTAQYIVTSITSLITSGQAAYINRLHGRIVGNPLRGKRLLTTYRLLLSGWWILTIAAVLGAFRIIFGTFEIKSFYFDLTILSLLAVGYLVLCGVAWRSWGWSPPKQKQIE